MVEYRDIEGWPGFRVGNDGSIWSCRQRSGEWRLLKPTAESTGHLYVDYKSDGVKRRKYVHTIVLESFVGPRPPGCEALHGPDFSPSNNSVGNLRWGTRSENIRDAVAAGRWCVGRGHRKSKLVPAEVVSIRALCSKYPGQTGVQSFLARWFGVTTGIISEIHTRKRWRHVQ